MATVKSITRRRLIQALPFIGAAAALPAVAKEPAPAPAPRFEPIELPADRHEYWARARSSNPHTMRDFALGQFNPLINEHEKAEAAYLAAADADDDAAMSAAFEESETALLAICGYVPCSRHDERAKADFLARWTKDCELEPRHVAALIGSMGRYQDTFTARVV